jgi:hypothetical protein
MPMKLARRGNGIALPHKLHREGCPWSKPEQKDHAQATASWNARHAVVYPPAFAGHFVDSLLVRFFTFVRSKASLHEWFPRCWRFVNAGSLAGRWRVFRVRADHWSGAPPDRSKAVVTALARFRKIFFYERFG